MEEKKKSVGALAFNSGYPVISEFLGDKEMKPIQELFFVSRKMNNYLTNDLINQIEADYEKIKVCEPINFTYSKKVLWRVIEHIYTTNNQRILMKLVVPISFFDTIHSTCEKDVYKYYLMRFNRKTKEEKIKAFIHYLIRWNNWKDFIDELDLVIKGTERVSRKRRKFYVNTTKLLGEKFLQDLKDLRRYISMNIYSIKKYHFESNYISIIKKHKGKSS